MSYFSSVSPHVSWNGLWGPINTWSRGWITLGQDDGKRRAAWGENPVVLGGGCWVTASSSHVLETGEHVHLCALWCRCGHTCCGWWMCVQVTRVAFRQKPLEPDSLCSLPFFLPWWLRCYKHACVHTHTHTKAWETINRSELPEDESLPFIGSQTPLKN